VSQPARAVSAVVLAGGSSRRLDGTDKPMLTVAGKSLLQRTFDSLHSAGVTSIAVVGPERELTLPDGVVCVQESPLGAGPAASTLCGVAALTCDGDDLVIVLAADLPLVGETLIPLMTGAHEAIARGHDGAMLRADGHDQYLAHCARYSSLVRASQGDAMVNAPMKQLIERLDLVRVDVEADQVLDTDTWQAVAEARRALGGQMTGISEWAQQASVIAGVDGLPLDIDAILELARDAAHGIERPAAPVSTFILGYAAATAGLDAAGVAALASELGRAALAQNGDAE